MIEKDGNNAVSNTDSGTALSLVINLNVKRQESDISKTYENRNRCQSLPDES